MTEDQKAAAGFANGYLLQHGRLLSPFSQEAEIHAMWIAAYERQLAKLSRRRVETEAGELSP